MIIRIGGVTLDRRFSGGGDSYNEGDQVEELLLEAFRTGADTDELLRRDDRWPVLYQLSPERKNLLEVMDLRPTDRVLEIGAGMGALTGPLAERTARVDCVDLSERRCLANAWRNKDRDNVTVTVGSFQAMDHFRDYDAAVLVGVLEYAPSYYHDTESPARAMLEQVLTCLRPGGRLYAAIENRLGMKYFAGAAEDHLGLPFAGLTGGGAGVRTYSRSELRELLLSAGWETPYFYYPYPDYKLPLVIYSDDMPMGDYLPVPEDYDRARTSVFDELAARRSLTRPEDWKEFANSFLAEAVKPL